MTALRVGLLGCGVVGSAVAGNFVARSGELSARVGRDVDLARVAVRNVSKPRAVPLPAALLTNNAFCVATDAAIDVVVEVIGGLDPARELVVAALQAGKHVVTANKQLLSRHGGELHAIAAANGVALHYEGSVCGAIPVVRVLRDSLSGDRVQRVEAIVSGTANYVLTLIRQHGCSLEEALREAQARGYAEARPDDDLSGADSAAKAVLLARLAFGADLTLADVRYEGIGHVTPHLVDAATAAGETLRLVAELERAGDRVDVAVRLRGLPPGHELADVDGVDNALVVTTECAGRLFLRGAGAGGQATASAVLGDVLTALGRVVDDGM